MEKKKWSAQRGRGRRRELARRRRRERRREWNCVGRYMRVAVSNSAAITLSITNWRGAKSY